MDTVCWCNACYSRRFSLGPDSRQKFNDCDAQQALDYAFAVNASAEPIALDAVVEANRKLLLERSNVGVVKYKTTLANSGLTRRQLLQHALEEALDLANYLQAEIMRGDKANG